MLPDSKPREINKTPTCCPSPARFQAGDILIFNLRQGVKANHTTLAQGIYHNPGGHKDAVHAAFVIEIDGQKKIAHLRGDGFVVSDIASIKTLTHVYRPRIYQAEIAAELNRFIQQDQDKLKHKLHWKLHVSFGLFIGRLLYAIGIKSEDINHTKNQAKALPTRDEFISSSSICSKFLAQSYIASCNEITKEKEVDVRSFLMNITSNTLPKTLQCYLYRCSNYDYLVMPHQNARGNMVDHLLQIITREIGRLKKGGSKSVAKAQQLNDAIRKFQLRQLDEKYSNEDENIIYDFEQAKQLLKCVVPILKINTGTHLETPRSYQAVMKYASSQGIYSEYLKKELLFNTRNPDLTQEAKEAYHYSDKFALLYSQYRQLGYSDEESRFECEPSLTSWIKLNPRRNAAAAVAVLPFLFWSIPYGLSRVHHVKHRNAIMLDDELVSGISSPKVSL